MFLVNLDLLFADALTLCIVAADPASETNASNLTGNLMGEMFIKHGDSESSSVKLL